MEAELWAYGHVWKSDVFYGTMWEGPYYRESPTAMVKAGPKGLRPEFRLSKSECYDPHRYDPNYETSITAKSEPHG